MKVSAKHICVFTSTILFFTQNASSNHFSKERDFLQELSAPIVFTRHGLDDFLTLRFNTTSYTEDFLPYSLSHLLELLEYGKTRNEGKQFFESTFRLFANRMKYCHFITNGAVAECIGKLPKVISCTTSNFSIDTTHFSISVNELLYKTFLEKFDLFRTNVDTFFAELTTDITNTLKCNLSTADAIASEQCKQVMLRCLETMLLKIIWSPADDIDAWTSTKMIADGLYKLCELEILSQDELDDLYQSLIASFCNFLDLVGTDISDEAIEIMKIDACAANIHLFALDEQEAQLQRKSDRFLETLCRVKARKFARQEGLCIS